MIEDLYKETILELNRHPLNKNLLDDFGIETREFNPVCGDDITVRIKFDKVGNVIGIGHQGVGCAISTAAASVVTEAVKGRSKNEIMNMDIQTIYRLLGTEIIATRHQCALLALKAIQTLCRSN